MRVVQFCSGSGALTFVAVFLFALGGGTVMAEASNKPIDVVNLRTSAYNAHDMEGFLATYTPEVSILCW